MYKKDYYVVLGVSRNADEAELKKAYRQLALKYHPDRCPDDPEAEECFKEASEAFEVLCNPEKRSIYDRYGHAGLQNSGYQGFSGFGDVFSSFSDIFDGIFGGGGFSGRGTPRGADLRHDVEISFEDAVFGKSLETEIPRLVVCPKCHGSGAESASDTIACPTCGGRGSVVSRLGFIQMSSTCPRCRGSGRLIKNRCHVCKGKKLVKKRASVSIDIPPGVEDGNYVTLRGEGHETPGGTPGDLHVVFNVRRHKLFKRNGSDIVCELPISFAQAALGTHIEVPTLRSSTKLHIPAGTQSGSVFAIQGEGVPGRGFYSGGDLLVTVVVKTPTKLTSEQEALLKEFAKACGEDVPERKNSAFQRLAERISKSI
ncbi:MAG: molecular chaperone DnaJ [Candidatus Coatesbacteria bacterium]|nr:molecular chaperone DnaJ [Candidatus Coatesbacteria bacterium]